MARVVDHYHKTFCERADAQEYLKKRGLTDPDILRAFKVGYADGSLLKLLPKEGEVRAQLLSLGVVTPEKRESCWAAASWCRSPTRSAGSGRRSTAAACARRGTATFLAPSAVS